MKSLRRTLLELFTEGGLEIRTLSPGPAADSSGAQPAVLARTIIQADGDTIHFLSSEALRQPELVRAHLNKMKEEINSFGALKSILDHSKTWVSAASTLLAIHQTYQRNPMGIAAAAAIFVGAYCLMPALMSLVRFMIRRRLRRTQ